MMDRLEDYIKKNRKDLDKYTPPVRIWDEISRSLRKGRISAVRWFSAAAMVIVIFTTAALFYVAQNRKNNILAERENSVLLQTDPQLQETEIYYNTQVNYLFSEAIPLLNANPELKKELLSDMSHIDSLCSDIKNDLKDNVANQEVIEALVNNYRVKIRILEDMLAYLRQNKEVPKNKKDHAL